MDGAWCMIELFEDLVKDFDSTRAIVPAIAKVLLDFAKSQEENQIKWKKTVDEMSENLQKYKKEVSDLEKQIQKAKKMLDEEKLKKKRVIEERNRLENQLDLVRDLLRDDRQELNDETKQKLLFLSKDHYSLETIAELDSTGSVMSDLSYTRDEEDLALNLSGPETKTRKRQRGSGMASADSKRRRPTSSKSVEVGKGERLVAKTTVTMDQDGPVSATSVIETIPQTLSTLRSNRANLQPSAPPLSDSEVEDAFAIPLVTTPVGSNHLYSANNINNRPHTFQSKAMIKGDQCNVCNKRIRFSAVGSKCRDCKAVCHAHCKDSLPVPCIRPGASTPTAKGSTGTISDFAPSVAPMIPSLVVHCVKEVEARGLTEVGVYRIPGSDKEVRALKEKFLKGKGVPNLSQVQDIHVICGCLKDFLRSLSESLVTQSRWNDFANALNISDIDDRRAKLYQLTADLPQANRDTIVFLIRHLQKVADSPYCKMPTSNLGKMFGPGIVGLSQSEPEDIFMETTTANKVMAELLKVPADFWENLVKNSDGKENENDNMQKTPSSNSLMNFFATPGRSVRRLKKTRYFDTP